MKKKKEGKFTFKSAGWTSQPEVPPFFLFLIIFKSQVLFYNFGSFILFESNFLQATIPFLKDIGILQSAIIIQYLASNDCVPGVLSKCFMHQFIAYFILKINVYLILKQP